MKKLFFIISIFISSLQIFAQEPADALRYSWYIQGGTAREKAIGGAMGSLGGDLSATFVNPAGLGFYKTGDFVLTPAFNLLNNKAAYFGHNEKDNKNNLSFGTTGFVFGGSTARESQKRRSSALSIAINKTADFNSNILYRGVNTQSSYSQKFLEEISNNNIKDPNAVAQNFPFGTSLAFNTYWIDTVAGGTPGNYQFQSRATPLLSTGLIQENKISSKGGITEFALAGAANFNDKLYAGFTLGISLLNYERTTEFSEADATTNPNNKFDFATITQYLHTSGGGVNLKAGIIYKPSESVRLGLAIHSPTFYQLTDKYNSSVTTNTENYQGAQTQNSGTFTGGQDAEFKYWMFNPYRIIGSASYVLHEVEDVRKQKGFITADIEYINYKSSSFSTDPGNDDQSSRDYLKSLNKAIDNAYKGAFNFRVGGELKFTTIMARLGAAYYGNPYKDLNGEKGNRFQASGGLGYRDKGVFIDLTYVYTMTKDVQFPYRLQYSPYSGANIKSSGGNVIATVGFKL
ncbi:MAG: aromatic hydrocarbon degradation protein [Bacteroidetes bacterium]|nr:aromatic hydrocarbon degradation protein [Bacteroidota bacterium]MBS1930637.1 aromatic hydrocarbon degradation protein [Bacteroidota bacterium]